MEYRRRKRSRSEDDDAVADHGQRKVYVNQKLHDKNNPQKMLEVHEKTRKILFDGARNMVKKGLLNDPIPFYKQFLLMGNGSIHVRNVLFDGADLPVIRKYSFCCSKQTLLHAQCVNCSLPLCEECGYSCMECEKFICHSCVTVFGNFSDSVPVCTKCQIFLA